MSIFSAGMYSDRAEQTFLLRASSTPFTLNFYIALTMTDSTNPLVQAILNGPAGPPPLGVTSNFVNPPNIGPPVLNFTVATAVLTTIILAIRIFTKVYLMKAWDIEDYLIIPAWALGHVFITVEGFVIRDSGIGIDMWNLRLSRLLSGLRSLDNIYITYIVSVTLIKIAILVQLLRIFVPHRKANMILWWTINFTIAIIGVFYTVILGFAIWKCNPREKAWNPLLPGTCYDTNIMYQITGIFNIISDFAIFIIPIWPVWKLQLPRGKKLGIIAVFATGLLDCITSIMRTYESWAITDSTNFSRIIALMGIWTTAETGLGIAVCCLPVMPRFLQFLRLRLHSPPKSRITKQSWSTKTSESERSDAYTISPVVTINHDGEKTSNTSRLDRDLM